MDYPPFLMDLVKPISDTQGLCAQLEENKTVIHISSNNCNEYSAVFFTYSHSANEKKKTGKRYKK